MPTLPITRRAVAAFAAAPLLAASLAAGRPSPARAQPPQQRFPSRPLRVVVPFPPGQSNDIFARLLADKASELVWPQHRVVVENRAGAGGTIGMGAVAQAVPDGHMLVFGSLATLAINPAVMRNVPYDPERDFAPVIRVFEGPLFVVVPAKGPDLDLAALARRLRGAGGGKMTYASSGPGSTQHMAAELLLQGIGARATHVPYRGSGPAMTDLSAGAVDFALEGTAVAMPMVQSGLLRALAVTSASRLPALPEVPTVAESAGLPGYAAIGSGGLLAPARTPAPVLEALYEGFAAAATDPTVRARFTEAGVTPLAEKPEAFATFIRAELAKWREVARRGDVALD